MLYARSSSSFDEGFYQGIQRCLPSAALAASGEIDHIARMAVWQVPSTNIKLGDIVKRRGIK